MTQEQFNALIEYIDAAIREANSVSASDGGLLEDIQKSRARTKLETLLVASP
jgi:hypothetical protein